MNIILIIVEILLTLLTILMCRFFIIDMIKYIKQKKIFKSTTWDYNYYLFHL